MASALGHINPQSGQQPPSASEQISISNPINSLKTKDQPLTMVTVQRVSLLGLVGYIAAAFTTVLKSITFKIENVIHASFFIENMEVTVNAIWSEL